MSDWRFLKSPNFFIVGAPRAGTTSLYNYLNEISEVFMSPVKEPGFFIPNDFRNFSEKTYLELFENVKDEIAIGEATAGYLGNEKTPFLIKEKVPNAKIIITLRDPVNRIFSHYLNRLRTGDTKLSFEDAVKQYFDNNSSENQIKGLIKGSLYHNQVQRYFEVFDKNNVKILIFEETIKDTKKAIKEILEFLEIKNSSPKNIDEVFNSYSEPLGTLGTNIVKNKTINTISKKILPKSNREKILRTILNKKGKKPSLSETTRKQLEPVFYEDVKNLEKTLGKTLPWKTKKIN